MPVQRNRAIALGVLLTAVFFSPPLLPGGGAGKLLDLYLHQAWQVRDGLPQNTVSAIVQSDDGYLWFATQEGLARYNGFQFRVFDQVNTPVLASAHMSALARGQGNVLFAASWHSGLFRIVEDRIQPLPHREIFSELLVSALLQTRDGSLWVGTSKGLYRLADDKPEKIGTADGLKSEDIRALVEGADGRIWIGTADGGLGILDRGRLSTLEVGYGIPDNRIWALAAASDGGIWAGSGTSLCRIRNGKVKTFPLPVRNADNLVRALSFDGQGNLWVSVQNEGVWRWRDGEIATFGTEDGLTQSQVLSLFVDHEGSVWMGTSGGGVNRLRERRIFTLREGLSTPALWDVYEDREGRFWMGTNGGGLCCLDNGRMRVYTQKDGLSAMIVSALYQSRDGTIWAGTYGHGLNRLQGGRFSLFQLGETSQEKTIWCVFEDRRGSLWVGTASGLYRISGEEISVFTKKDGLRSDSVRTVCEDRLGNLWIATQGGLNSFQDGRLLSWADAAKEVGNPYLMSVYADDQDNIWMTTLDKGLLHFRNGRFTSISTKNGLFYDIIHQIVEDDCGHLWISSNRGVFYTLKQELLAFVSGKVKRIHCGNFDEEDGMANSECNGGCSPAGIRTRDGRICFPTMGGLAILKPQRFFVNSQPPKVVIEEARIDKVSFRGGAQTVFNPGKGDLQFNFAALTFISPHRVHFFYRLQPYQQEWVASGPRRDAFFTNIPPGRYTFEVRAVNEDGIWSRRKAVFSFYLKPHFRQTWWFYLLTGLSLAVIGVTLYRLRVRRLRRREKELQAVVAERTAQLEEANRELEKMAMTDGLTGMANFRYFSDIFQREWSRAQRQRSEISLVLIDIDFFKLYNDAFGRLAGDDCLKMIAEALKRAVSRITDLAARYGGEEFIVLLPETDTEGAVVVAERVFEEVAELAIPFPKSTVAPVVTVSIGISTVVPQLNMEPEVLYKKADHALLRSKEGGRNRLTAANETDF